MAGRPKRKKFFRLPIPKRWVEQAVDLEFEHHLLERIDELIEEGYRPEEARAEAERCFGSSREFRRDCIKIGERRVRSMKIVEGIQSVVQDVKYALRAITKKPSFALAVIVTLGLGIGANGAVFTVMDTALLRPLPYDDPRTLVQVNLHSTESGFSLFGFPRESALMIQQEAEFLESVVLYGNKSAVRTDGEFPIRVSVYGVSTEFLPTVGVQPTVGRGFRPGDHEPGAERVVVLSDRAWSEWMGRSDDVIGSTIELDEVTYTIVGVLPPQFKLLGDFSTHLFLPMTADGEIGGEEVSQLRIYGRNRAQLSTEVMNERGSTLLAGLAEEGHQLFGFDALQMRVLWEQRANPGLQKALFLMFAGAVLLLVVAIANGVNLFLIRGSERAGELGVRLSLGGSRRRIGRQILTESLVLSVFGGILGTFIAYYGVNGLMAIAPEFGLSTSYHITFDIRGLLYVFGVTVLVGTALGLIPAIAALRKDRTARLLQGHGAVGRGRVGGFGRASNVVGQIAVALVLLTGAALLSRSFLHIVAQDVGFDSDRVAILNMGLSNERYPTPQDQRLFFERLEQRVSTIPGVESVALAQGTPPQPIVAFGFQMETEETVGDPPEQPEMFPTAVFDHRSFDVLGIEITEGRGFRPGESRDDLTAVVDGAFARMLWGGESAVGRRFREGENGEWVTVVGVVENLMLAGQDVTYPAEDLIRPLGPESVNGFTDLIIRFSGSAQELMPHLRAAVRELDPLQPIYSLQTGTEAMAEGWVTPRFYALLLVCFALIAVALAGTGVYGVLAYSMSRRRREVGLRIALGARPRDVESMVVWDGVRLALFGAVLGVGGSLLCSQVLESLLFDVAPNDLKTFCMSAFGMIALVVVASYVPARRATRVDPVEVLGAE